MWTTVGETSSRRHKIIREEINRHLCTLVLVTKRKKEHAKSKRNIKHYPILLNMKLCESLKAWWKIPWKFWGWKTSIMWREKMSWTAYTPTQNAATIFMLITKKGKLKCSMWTRNFCFRKRTNFEGTFLNILTCLKRRSWLELHENFRADFHSLDSMERCWARKQQQSSTRERRWRISCNFYNTGDWTKKKYALTCRLQSQICDSSFNCQ